MQFQFTALNFSLLHPDLRVLLYLCDFDSLGNDLLLRHVGLDIIRFVGGGLLLLYFSIKSGFFQCQVALRFSLETERLGFSLDSLLIGGGLGDGGFTSRIGLLNLGIALCQGSGDIGLFANLGDLWSSHVRDVIVAISHVFNGERDDFQAHLIHIRSDGLEHLGTNVLGVFHQFFNGQLTNDTTQVAFHDEADEILSVLLGLTEELLGSSSDALFVGAHFNLGNGLNIDSYTL